MSNIIDVRISLEQKYQIVIGKQLRERFQSFCRGRYPGNKIFVLADENVWGLHQKKIERFVDCFDDFHAITIPEGESSKSVSQWEKIIDKLLKTGVERETPLLAVGGGVTGDLGGFVASATLRGIPLIHLPTSLLAMVDSSIGGKTGVNHPTGKNLIGSFYQPDAVFSDITFLETLERREWINGMAEILKYAAIGNPKLFEEIEKLVHRRLSPVDDWVGVVEKSARIKAEIVRDDVLESGKRAYLNFGHTFGHALEKASGYGTVSHGEGVFVGMIAAAYFSSQHGHAIDSARFSPFISLYRKQMSTLPEDINLLVEAMKNDKKVKENTLRLVLLKEWGSPYIYDCDNISELYDAWEFALAQFNENF